MIGVVAKADERPVVEEFFELFKTPWELYRPGRRYDVIIATCDEIPEVQAPLLIVYGSASKSFDAYYGFTALSRRRSASLRHQKTQLPIYGDLLTFADTSAGVACATADSDTAGLAIRSADGEVLRLGFDLFQEVSFLLSDGQPVENAHIPTLDIHITMLRDWILGAGIALLEIPPVPAGHDFVVCLTHDIDFVGIKNHCFDHSMWGFLYRSTVGALRDLLRGRISISRLFKMWRAVAALPFVYLGWAEDFWEPFGWYLVVEKDLPATYFLIPFKRQSGEKVPGPYSSRRATAYDVGDLPQWTAVLLKKGCELGVHGIDAWHSAEKGREELAAVAAVTGESSIGTRMHWLLRDASTPSVLERAGYAYDSTFGYNETVGYRSGTSQVFRPAGAQTLLELPLHIQDGALFYPQRLDLSEPEAEKRCSDLVDNANKFGGVLTLLWHDRSHGPERFWGDFYIRLVGGLKSSQAWFATATRAVGWFRKRREVHFDQVDVAGTTRTSLRYNGEEVQPPLRIRVHRPRRRANEVESVLESPVGFIDVTWNGQSINEMEFQSAARFSGQVPNFTVAPLT